MSVARRALAEVPAPARGDQRTSIESMLLAARAGDTAALGRIFVELQPRLLRFLRSQDRGAADDLAGDVWLGVAAGLSSFVGGWDDFRAWFFTIARRRLLDHRRMAARRRTDATDIDAFATRPGFDGTEQIAIDNLSGEAAAALITESLSADQAEVVLLRVLGDLDADQVASIVGRTANWVRVTQHRALRKLGGQIAARAGSAESGSVRL